MNPASSHPITRGPGDASSELHVIALLAAIAAIVLASLALAAHFGWIPAPPGLSLKAFTPKVDASALQVPCGRCGVVEAVEIVDARRTGPIHLGLTGPVAVQQAGALGQDLSKALALLMLALAPPRQQAEPPRVYATTVRFEDGSGRVFTGTSLPAWQPGERVKVVNGRILPLQ